MIDISIAIAAACAGFAAGWICGTAVERRQSRWQRHPPYSSAAIAFCATQEDAAKVSSQFINPAVGEPWPEPMTVEEWACRRGPRLDPGTVQRGNGHGGPTTPKAQIRPTPQQPLTADLIRYWKWQDEQVRQALKDGNNNPLPGDAP